MSSFHSHLRRSDPHEPRRHVPGRHAQQAAAAELLSLFDRRVQRGAAGGRGGGLLREWQVSLIVFCLLRDLRTTG